MLLERNIIYHHYCCLSVYLCIKPPVLSSLGLSASYEQVMSFEKAAAVHVGNKFLDVLKAEGKLPFCQWVADNFGLNEDTISSENTTHVMGIITCINAKPESIMPIDVPRKTVSNKEIVNAGSLIHYLDKYRPRCDSPLFELQIKELQKTITAITNFISLDLLRSFSSLFVINPPNWQGFTSYITNGHYECTTVIFNPMVPLNPDTNEIIYCTMRFVVDEGEKIGLCCGTLTFDQPLYLKANHIKYSFPDEFVSVHLC